MELLGAEDRGQRTHNIPVTGEHTSTEEISHYPNGIIHTSFRMVGKVCYPI